jgi:hypothetical protein
VYPLKLQTSVTVSRGCQGFYFQDVTPEYDVLTEPNGYDPAGIGSVDPSDIDSNNITIEITNMANPGYSQTILVPSTAFDPNQIPGVVQYEIPNTSFSNITYTVSAATSTTPGLVTTYTTSTPHTYVVGQTVTVSGLLPTQFNVTGVVLAVPTNDTFTLSSIAVGSASNTGSVSGQGITTGDGVYKFVYTIVDTDPQQNNQIYQAVCYVLNDCGICCELDQRLKDLKNCGTCNENNNKSVNALYDAYMLRQKAHHLVACYDIAGAQEILDYLTRMLDLKTCDNCNS